MGISTFAPVNKEVSVNSFYFRNQTNSLKSYPHQIEYEGRFITFMDSGLRLLVKSGQRLAELFDMSDGNEIYRLKLENNNWTLIGVKAA